MIELMGEKIFTILCPRLAKNFFLRQHQVDTGYSLLPGHVAQSVTCLTADPGIASSIPARSHTFVEIDHEIISTVSRVYESFPDFTGQPVWWTGKICLTNHDFTRPTPYENKQQNKKIVSLNVL